MDLSLNVPSVAISVRALPSEGFLRGESSALAEA